MLKCSFNKHHHPNVVIFEITRSLHTIRYSRYSIFTFKLVFEEHLTSNVMQITLINSSSMHGNVFMDIVSTSVKVLHQFGRRVT